MEFQLSYFKSWKMMLWKCCTQYASRFGKLSSGHRTGKGQFSFQSQRKAMPKNAKTTTQLHSSHMLGCAQNSPSQASAIREPWTSRCSSWILKRHRNQRSNCQHLLDHQKSKYFWKNTYFCFIDYVKDFVWIMTKCGKFWKDWNTRQPDLALEKYVCRSRSNS